MGISIRDRLIKLLVGDQLERLQLTVRALDDARDRMVSRSNTEGTRDRYQYDRRKTLEDALEAWRTNPLARRIVGLMSDYVVGGGLSINCEHEPTKTFLDDWWNHRLNHMLIRAYEWCDELTRSGELFITISTDAAGMSYCRAIPAAEIEDAKSAPNDIEQEITFYQTPVGAETEPIPWAAYNAADDDTNKPVMLHYAVNRPVGAKFGESDLGPELAWLKRYSDWLENRARLNKYRNIFLWIVQRLFNSEPERKAYEQELNANPPNPGSILVINKDETWEAKAPNLESKEAAEDGMALKKMIAAGAAIPMHFLAEPESSTRTTAEQSGGPTFRFYDRRQIYFLWMIADIAQICVNRRARFDHGLDTNAKIIATGTDISTRDNTQLAEAATSIVTAFIQLHDRHLITDEELVRLSYKFAGEIIDVDALLKKARSQPWPKTPTPSPSPNPNGQNKEPASQPTPQ